MQLTDNMAEMEHTFISNGKKRKWRGTLKALMFDYPDAKDIKSITFKEADNN